MTFLNPWLLFGALGVSLPVIAHLLNRYDYKLTDWAAMRFLNRTVRVVSRQLRLRDILLLVLRCLAVVFLVLAAARPTTKEAGGVLSALGERRAGVVIALDASFSMMHTEGGTTRFERAVRKVETITEGIPPGSPVHLVLLGAEHRVVVRNMLFDPERFGEILNEQRPSHEPLDLDSVPRRLKALADEMDAVQKEVYIISDMQERDWKNQSPPSREAFTVLGKSASVYMVPVLGGHENVAIASLKLMSGVLRKGTIARYRATVRNCGTNPVTNVRVKGLVDGISVDAKTIPSIAPRTSETVSLFVPFRNPGPVRISASLEADALEIDNSRRAMAVVRERVSVLCVEGDSGGSEGTSGFITSALRARGTGGSEEDFSVRSVPWVALPAEDLDDFDVVIVADVPDITPDQAARFEKFVRQGNGLIWFAGDNVKAASWNERSRREGIPLLPAVIERAIRTSDAMGVGRPLDPTIPNHSVCRPLLSLPEDLLSETRFLRLLQVTPSASSLTVLSLAGSATPVLIEHSMGRGHVFMFTTSAGPEWNNMALTPVFPMLLQQMVTYLTAREFEMPRRVGDSLSLSFVDEPDAGDAVFDTPSGETVVVPVREYRSQYVAMLEHAGEAGFYRARVSVQAPGIPVAVNVDTGESDVSSLSMSELVKVFEGTDIAVARSDMELADAIERTRTGRSLWRVLMVAGLLMLVAEGLFADRLLRKPSRAEGPGPSSATAEKA